MMVRGAEEQPMAGVIDDMSNYLPACLWQCCDMQACVLLKVCVRVGESVCMCVLEDKSM